MPQHTSICKAMKSIQGGSGARSILQNASTYMPRPRMFREMAALVSSTANGAMGRWQRRSYKKKPRNNLSRQRGLRFGHRAGSSQDRICHWQQKPLSVVRGPSQPQPKLLSALVEQRGGTWGECQCGAKDGGLGGKLKTRIKLKWRGAVQYGAVGLGCRRQTPCINQAQVCQAEKSLLLQWYTIAQ